MGSQAGGVGAPPTLGNRRAHVFITGDVQGVFFRDSLRKEAETFNVRGWARNLPDGRVEAVLEGTDYAVERLVQWCHKGPEKARVRHVEIQEEDPEHKATAFEIRA